MFCLQASSHNESTSTLQFGSRVSEITLGQAKKNVESGMMLDAKEASVKLQRETAAAKADAARFAQALEYERAEAEQLRCTNESMQRANESMQQELSRLKVGATLDHRLFFSSFSFAPFLLVGWSQLEANNFLVVARAGIR
jgi:hypothetical protein